MLDTHPGRLSSGFGRGLAAESSATEEGPVIT